MLEPDGGPICGGMGEMRGSPDEAVRCSDRNDTLSHMCSVAGDGGVNKPGPAVDSAGERLNVVESLIAEPHRDGERPDSVMAEDDDGLVGVELLVGAGRDVAHGHQFRLGEVGGVSLPWFADV